MHVLGPSTRLALLAAVLWGCGPGLRVTPAPSPTSSASPSATVGALTSPPQTPGAATSSPSSVARNDEVINGLVSVGDHRLFVECRGSGSPTIVFSNGAGSNHHEWDPIFGTLAERTRACRYDLPNTGLSEAIDRVRTVADDVGDLHRLADAGILAAPFVFVAFSAGGFPVRQFAAQHPDRVAGIVFVDPLLAGYEAAYQELLPESDRPARRAARAGDNAERYDYTASEAQLRPAAELGPFPVVVIANDRHIRWESCDFCDPLVPTAQRLVDEFVASLPRGRAILVASPHWITGRHPQLVEREIIGILDVAG